MQIQINEQVAKYIHNVETLQENEQDLFLFTLLQNYAKRNNSVQEIQINNQIAYFYFPNSIYFQEKEEPKKRKLGLWEGKITYIAPDFNEPLDDMADYM